MTIVTPPAITNRARPIAIGNIDGFPKLCKWFQVTVEVSTGFPALIGTQAQIESSTGGLPIYTSRLLPPIADAFAFYDLGMIWIAIDPGQTVSVACGL